MNWAGWPRIPGNNQGQDYQEYGCQAQIYNSWAKGLRICHFTRFYQLYLLRNFTNSYFSQSLALNLQIKSVFSNFLIFANVTVKSMYAVIGCLSKGMIGLVSVSPTFNILVGHT